MSTQQPVRGDAKAAPVAGAKLAVAYWAWIIATAVAGILAIAFGVNVAVVADVVTVAAAPAFAGLFVFQARGTPDADTGLIAIWLTAAAVLTAATGGALSPLAASFLIAPALARALRRRPGIVAGAAFAGYVLAAGAELIWPAANLDPLTPMFGAISLAFAAALAALAYAGRAEAAETAVREAREQAVSRRIAEVSHELRTPLTHILGFAEILERQMFGPIGERNVEYAGLIRKSGANLLDLVNDLLDLSKIEAGRYDIEMEEFDARAIVEEVARLSSESAAKKNIGLDTKLPERALDVRADSRALRRMLINTVGNAVKFTPEGGRIVLAGRSEGEKLVLDTIDNGPGIPPEEKARLGAAYEQGASGAVAGGTGLGLSLVRALAELHGGGTLSFHDAPGGGALVRIEMPVMRA